VSGSLCHDAVMVIDVAVRMGIKVCQLPQTKPQKAFSNAFYRPSKSFVQGALRSTITGKAESRRISRWLFAGDVGKRSSRTFKAFNAVLDTCPVPSRGARRSSLMSHRR